MTSNRSLDEFAGSSDEPDAVSERDDAAAVDTEGEAVAETGPAETVDGVPDPDASDDGAGDVPPAASTYAWSPEGGPCAACGERAQERWREGEDLVCAGCKDW